MSVFGANRRADRALVRWRARIAQALIDGHPEAAGLDLATESVTLMSRHEFWLGQLELTAKECELRQVEGLRIAQTWLHEELERTNGAA